MVRIHLSNQDNRQPSPISALFFAPALDYEGQRLLEYSESLLTTGYVQSLREGYICQEFATPVIN